MSGARSAPRVLSGLDLHFRSTVPADPVAIAYVRHSMQSFSEVYGGERAGDLALVFTELVTNSIRHAGLRHHDVVGVDLTLRGESIFGSVTDDGRGFDPAQLGSLPARGGGFGLFIVARLTKRWGVDSNPQKTRVWFEL